MIRESRLIWQINLRPILGHKIVVETHDGHYRQGALTEVKWAEFKLFKVPCQYPAELILDGDRNDTIPFTLVKSIRHAGRDGRFPGKEVVPPPDA